MHLEHLTITRKTVTGLADRLPAVAPELPEYGQTITVTGWVTRANWDTHTYQGYGAAR